MGTITGAVGIAQDVTALKASAEISSGKADVLRQIIEETKVPVIGVDMQGFVNEWNGASAKLFGWGAGEVFGAPLIDILRSPKHNGNEVADVFQEVLEEPADVQRQVSCLTKGGSWCNVMLNITPLRSGGKLTGAICFAYRVPEPQAAVASVVQATAASHHPEHAVESLAAIPEDSSSPASAEVAPTVTSRGAFAEMVRGHDFGSGESSTLSVRWVHAIGDCCLPVTAASTGCALFGRSLGCALHGSAPPGRHINTGRTYDLRAISILTGIILT
jgi:PAS domain S-box-containing protein